jgi:arsenate reductase (thioredoxin)
MVCTDADGNCPYIPECEKRFLLPYLDPKVADNTPEEEGKYQERSMQIATEMGYLFGKLKS